MTSRVLFILTNTDYLRPQIPTGVWVEEYAIPLRMLRQQDIQVVVSSPEGGTVPIDPKSLESFDAESYADELNLLNDSKPLANINETEFDAVFIPGGHGPLIDLPTHPKVKAILRYFDAYRKPIVALCHGLAALTKVTTTAGKPLVEGREVTGFSNEEETGTGLDDVVPFAIEDRLREQGAKYVKARKPFESMVVVDGHFITGQNPASSRAVAEKLIEQLKSAKSAS
jgi:putative intracellular protease/amidase